jgi:hypothetical protein
MFVLIDCPADSGAAETHTADKHKMAVSPRKRQCFAVLGDKISYSSEKTLPPGEQAPKGQSIKRDGWNRFKR